MKRAFLMTICSTALLAGCNNGQQNGGYQQQGYQQQYAPQQGYNQPQQMPQQQAAPAPVPTVTQTVAAQGAPAPGVNEEGGGTESIADMYSAQIAVADTYSSSGAKLSDVAAIIQQDRANYHKGQGQPGDEADHMFSDKSQRAQIGAMLRRGSIDASARQRILSGSGRIQVTVIERNGVMEMSVN